MRDKLRVPNHGCVLHPRNGLYDGFPNVIFILTFGFSSCLEKASYWLHFCVHNSYGAATPLQAVISETWEVLQERHIRSLGASVSCGRVNRRKIVFLPSERIDLCVETGSRYDCFLCKPTGLFSVNRRTKFKILKQGWHSAAQLPLCRCPILAS